MANRQDNCRITVSVDGRQLGVFEDRTGGASDSTSVMYKRGGLGPREALGGAQEPTNVVVMRLMDDEVRTYIKWLRGRAGRGQMVVTELPLDDEGVAAGEPEVFTGKLKSVHPGDRKADGAAAQTLELEMLTQGIA